LAESYETACFVMEDGPSRDLLARFAVDYVKAQNREEIAEFSGAVVFEIVLIGLLVMHSGGAGLAAKGAASVRNLALTQRLGTGLKRLGQGLKNARIKKAGRAEGKGAGAQVVELERPKALKPKVGVAPISAGVLRGASRAIIDKRKLTSYALNPAHPTGGNKARVFESALGFTVEHADDLLKQLKKGVLMQESIVGKVDSHGSRFTVDIPVVGPKRNGVVRTGWIYVDGADAPTLTTLFVR